MDENSNADMKELVIMLRRLARLRAIPLLIVHHSRKGASGGDQDGARGGSALVNACRVVVNDQRTIAKALGLSHTAYRDLVERDEAAREALARGHGALADELTHHLLKAARSGNITAAIYLTKARLGWIEGQAPEGAPKTAVQVNIQIPRAMTDAEFARVIEGTAAPARSREGGSGPPPATGEVSP